MDLESRQFLLEGSKRLKLTLEEEEERRLDGKLIKDVLSSTFDRVMVLERGAAREIFEAGMSYLGLKVPEEMFLSPRNRKSVRDAFPGLKIEREKELLDVRDALHDDVKREEVEEMVVEVEEVEEVVVEVEEEVDVVVEEVEVVEEEVVEVVVDVDASLDVVKAPRVEAEKGPKMAPNLVKKEESMFMGMKTTDAIESLKIELEKELLDGGRKSATQTSPPLLLKPRGGLAWGESTSGKAAHLLRLTLSPAPAISLTLTPAISLTLTLTPCLTLTLNLTLIGRRFISSLRERFSLENTPSQCPEKNQDQDQDMKGRPPWNERRVSSRLPCSIPQAPLRRPHMEPSMPLNQDQYQDQDQVQDQMRRRIPPPLHLSPQMGSMRLP